VFGHRRNASPRLEAGRERTLARSGRDRQREAGPRQEPRRGCTGYIAAHRGRVTVFTATLGGITATCVLYPRSFLDTPTWRVPRGVQPWGARRSRRRATWRASVH